MLPPSSCAEPISFPYRDFPKVQCQCQHGGANVNRVVGGVFTVEQGNIVMITAIILHFWQIRLLVLFNVGLGRRGEGGTAIKPLHQTLFHLITSI